MVSYLAIFCLHPVLLLWLLLILHAHRCLSVSPPLSSRPREKLVCSVLAQVTTPVPLMVLIYAACGRSSIATIMSHLVHHIMESLICVFSVFNATLIPVPTLHWLTLVVSFFTLLRLLQVKSCQHTLRLHFPMLGSIASHSMFYPWTIGTTQL